MSDPTESLCSKISLSQSKVKPYNGFIFLCGGPADAGQLRPLSVRDAIYRGLATSDDLERRIRVAEHYKDWAHDSIYKDLVLFERHIAELSSVIVLVLESPGAIAELGLFTAIDEFQAKLLVFIDSVHYKDALSFIKQGPINFLEKTHENQAECHTWLKPARNGEFAFDVDAAEELQTELADSVRARLSKTPAAEVLFENSRWLHVAFLICDLINLLSALTVREIKEHLAALGVERTEGEVKQTLYILERVELLTMEPKGDQRFYIGSDERQFLKFQLIEREFDLDRFRADVLAYYKANDKKRFRAIQAVRSRP